MANTTIVPKRRMMDNTTLEIQKQLQALHDLVKIHAQKVANPKCAALCETTAEVLGGLTMAYEHFHKNSELAWK